MVQTINQRVAAKIEGDFVVFLIGARLNRRWKFLSFIPIARAMSRMVGELEANRDHGMLHVEMWSGRTTVMVQYWRSFEHLHAYARMRDAQHLPAWADFNRRIGSNGDFGIWHETFMVKAGQYEGFYNNMPEFGLAKAGEWVPAAGKQNTAKGRLQLSDGSDEPVYEESVLTRHFATPETNSSVISTEPETNSSVISTEAEGRLEKSLAREAVV